MQTVACLCCFCFQYPDLDSKEARKAFVGYLIHGDDANVLFTRGTFGLPKVGLRPRCVIINIHIYYYLVLIVEFTEDSYLISTILGTHYGSILTSAPAVEEPLYGAMVYTIQAVRDLQFP